MADEYEVYLMRSSVRGYHAYFKDATVFIGEVLPCERELNNVHDKYAIVVKNGDDKTVGHVPIELSKVVNKFIRDYGEIEVECIGARYNRGEEKGLEIPVEYKLIGNSKYLERLASRLKKNEATCGLNISDVRKCQT